MNGISATTTPSDRAHELDGLYITLAGHITKAEWARSNGYEAMAKAAEVKRDEVFNKISNIVKGGAK